ncbi:YbaK/EbsC family protein [Vibrio sp. Of7-15]|uniref:aminoacyl-tRNA deacylase n=1 Tax=Vibrio sp. Of7-15 TaxID=2724879 RepID=UPI001EF2C5C2|nr:YbaK/EbsC family protein [Vibrio sp. Of7-15]MCG7499057.1 YbaK/EbsC family protein [Vibrio sp. Of7-15]
MNNFSTSIIEFLRSRQVDYRLLCHQTPAKTIEDAAKQRGVLPGQMVKSILLRDMGGLYALACVPGDQQVDPKKVRAFLQCRRMTCVDAESVQEVTGFALGTVAPIALKAPIPIIMDPQLQQQEWVNISSGSNMAGLELRFADLIQLCQPSFYAICR